MEDREMIEKNEVNKAILHLNFANRRMLIALICVCITAIILSIGTILIFVHSHPPFEVLSKYYTLFSQAKQ